jgi:hypothetical protein
MISKSGEGTIIAIIPLTLTMNEFRRNCNEVELLYQKRMRGKCEESSREERERFDSSQNGTEYVIIIITKLKCNKRD